METLMTQALESCPTPEQEQQARQLLTAYAAVFISGESDVRKTNLVENVIPMN